jgi:hypothetical protein
MAVGAQEATFRGPHCGVVSEVDGQRFELVVTVQTLILYSLDNDNHVLRELLIGGKAAIDAGGLSEQIHLTSYDGVISGTGSFPETGQLQVDVEVLARNGETLHMSFGEIRLRRSSWPW